MKVVITGQPAWQAQIEELVARRGGETLSYERREGYVARLADDYAALVLVDGEDEWDYWVTTPKVNAATRRIPVILVAEDESVHEAALRAGADRALTPARLAETLPDLLDDVARVSSGGEVRRIERQCSDPLPSPAREAVRLFNAGEFYKQHDLFEALWMEEEGPVRDLYRAVLQVGVAYYQIGRGNRRGALKMLLRSLQWLANLPDVCQGIDVARLRADSGRVRAALEALPDDDDLADFDHSLLKPVRLVG